MVEPLRNRKILVTGGNGYLASCLLRCLIAEQCTVVRFGRKGTSWTRTTAIRGSEVREVEGDIRDQGIWDSLLDGTDIVFHFAAQTSVYRAASEPVEDLKVNVLPMLNMLEACRRGSFKPIILFSGTHTEAGIPDHLPVNEEHPDRPVTVYDIHKLMSENYLKQYVKEGTVRGATLRLANVYGPGPKSSNADRGMLNQMVRKAMNDEPITIHGDGNFTRDYIYVDDVSNAFLAAASNIERVNGGHFVVGSGKGYTLSHAFNLVADRVGRRTGKKVKVTHVEPPASLSPIESRNFVADSSLFSKLTQWEPRIGLDRGIDLTIESFLREREQRPAYEESR